MKTLLWKLRYVLEFRRLTKMSFRAGWDHAEAWLEMVNGDLSESTPAEAVETELSYWVG